MLDTLILALTQVATLQAMLGLSFGTLLGFVFGVVPGLQSITALVVVLPFTFGMDPVMAMYIFAGIIGSAGRGGSITAIALGIPGTAQNAATVLDGYPMTQRGETSRALGIAASTAMLGATFGLVTLVLFMPVFMSFLMSFGPAERFWVMTVGLVAMAIALPTNFLAGVAAVAIGLILSCIGFGGPTIAVPRFTFGSTYLSQGLDLVAVIIGLLVVGEAIEYLLSRPSGHGAERRPGPLNSKLEWVAFLKAMREPFHYPVTLFRSSAVGTLIGAIPGVGGVVAQFLSYNISYAASREKEKYGDGSVEGLIAAEAAADSKEGGVLLPTVAFGIPGNGEMALVLAAWMIHGLQPGPFMFQTNGHLVWALIFGLFIANIYASVLTLGCCAVVARLPRLRPNYIGVCVIVFSLLAMMSVRGNLWDAGLALAAGVFGYILGRAGIPVISVVIGFVLGRSMESDFYTALQSGRGDYSALLDSHLSIGLAAATLAIVTWAAVKAYNKRASAGLVAAAERRERRRPSAGEFLREPKPIALALLLLVLAYLTGLALAEGFRGGIFLRLSLLMAALLIGYLLIRSVLDMLGGAAPARPVSDEGVPEDVPAGSKWAPIFSAAGLLGGLFFLVVVGGMLVGLFVAVLGIMKWKLRASSRVSLAFAVCTGVLLPVIFSEALSISMWPGLIPTLVPGWVGGGVPPPL